MIPSSGQVVGFYVFLARRNGWSTYVSRTAIENALKMANDLASSADEEPAALFHALARFGKALGPAWFPLSTSMARNHAVSMGLVLDADPDQLRVLLVPIAASTASWELTRDWFAARLRPASVP